LETDKEHLALDTVANAGPGGEYLSRMHTFKHCRKAPFVSDISLQGIIKQGYNANDLLFGKMKDKIKQMLSTYRRPEFDNQTMKKLDTCMEKLRVDTNNLKQRMGIHS